MVSATKTKVVDHLYISYSQGGHGEQSKKDSKGKFF